MHWRCGDRSPERECTHLSLPVASSHRQRLSAPRSSIAPSTYSLSGDIAAHAAALPVFVVCSGEIAIDLAVEVTACGAPAQANDQKVVAGQLFLSESESYVLAHSPLRGVSDVPYPISDRVPAPTAIGRISYLRSLVHVTSTGCIAPAAVDPSPAERHGAT